MGSRVACVEQREALDLIRAGVDRLQAVGVAAVDVDDAVVLLGELEGVSRRVDALCSAVVAEVGRGGFHALDGHASAKVMARHVCRLSTGEATRRDRAARAAAAMPAMAMAWAAGEIGTEQVGVLARAHANERVREVLEGQVDVFLAHARELSYRDFAALVAAWVAYVDEDGTAERAQRSHERRDARLVQLFEGSWELTARFGSLVGAELDAIFAAYRKAELLADWDTARARYGDAATVEHLERSEAQRRADALVAIFRDAAAGRAAAGGPQITTDVVIDQATFERLLRKMCGAPVPPRDPTVEPPPTAVTDRTTPSQTRRGDDSRDRATTWCGATPPAGAGPPCTEPSSDEETTRGAAGAAARGEAVEGERAQDGDDGSGGSGGDSRDGGDAGHEHGPRHVDARVDGDAHIEPPGDFAHFRCSTLDGHPVDPTEAVAAALIGHVRRAVIDARSVTIDLGRRQRLFTGPAQLAARLAATECYWPGCHVPTTDCQTDHLTAWTDGGPTNPTNGLPACGRHNRFKDHHHYQVHLDQHGRPRIHRPDGTEVD